jgi:hypothetical protein
MLGAIGPSSSYYAERLSPSTAGLEAQLSRCRQQLSETVNCSSYHTLEGKNKAQNLSNRISELEGRIEQARNDTAQSKNVKATEKPPTNEIRPVSTPQDAETQTYASGTPGTRLNVYA